MNTTIQLDVTTKMILERVKKTYNAKTYDETIKQLVRKKTQSLYGSLARERKVSMGEILRTLRDKDGGI